MLSSLLFLFETKPYDNSNNPCRVVGNPEDRLRITKVLSENHPRRAMTGNKKKNWPQAQEVAEACSKGKLDKKLEKLFKKGQIGPK